MDRTWIERFDAGGPQLRRATAGLTAEHWDTPCEPGRWSIRELVIHLADSDAIAVDRMKRILTEDDPPLLWANDTAYVERLHCEVQSPEDALVLFEVGRRQWSRVLRALPDADFERVGTHNKKGRLTLAEFVSGYVEHLEHHLAFLRGKRARLGVPLAE